MVFDHSIRSGSEVVMLRHVGAVLKRMAAECLSITAAKLQLSLTALSGRGC